MRCQTDLTESDDQQGLAEVFLMSMRYLCEERQMDHIHISDSNRSAGNKYEVVAKTFTTNLVTSASAEVCLCVFILY